MKENEASSTALTVLQGILYTARKPEYAYLVDDEFKQSCERMLNASEQGRKRLKQLDNWFYRECAVPVLQRLLAPNITLHYVLRKRGIEDYARTQLKKGMTQVINLGAGLDTLAYRLSKKYPEVSFIEIDHPATQNLKEQFFKSSNEALENLHYLPIDFTEQTLEGELSQFAAFSAEKPTLFICEGVLMYLNEQQVKDLFSSLKKLCNHQLHFVFTALEPEDHSHNSLLKRYLQTKGEAIHWLKPKAEMADFVSHQGFTLDEIATEEILCSRYLKGEVPKVLLTQEYLAHAQVTEN
ncbi:MAG: SAM-dependent methyltransferase [Methylococcaceae bacterium]|nr:SAM-dependent methyltransferase [Methylococcaceae bacterium]